MHCVPSGAIRPPHGALKAYSSDDLERLATKCIQSSGSPTTTKSQRQLLSWGAAHFWLRLWFSLFARWVQIFDQCHSILNSPNHRRCNDCASSFNNMCSGYRWSLEVDAADGQPPMTFYYWNLYFDWKTTNSRLTVTRNRSLHQRPSIPVLRSLETATVT